MDMDLSFLENEDFGLAKSFSTAPILSIAPHVNFQQKERADIDRELSEEASEAFVSEGFCFKLAPGQNVNRFCVNQIINLDWSFHEITETQGTKTY